MAASTNRRAEQSLDQQRAAFAWRKVAEARTKFSQSEFNAYTTLAKSAPALMMGNGLMATLAFFQPKSDEARARNDAVGTWLSRRMDSRLTGSSYREVMEGLHRGQRAHHLQATEEAREVLGCDRQLAPTPKE